jgi:hypothetical protein
MVQRRTNKGQIIDFESLMAQQKETPAMGNMRVDANGNLLGPNGEIIEKRENRVRAYYQDNPMSSTDKKSLKGEEPQVSGSLDNTATAEIKTAQTAKENKRTEKIQPDPQPEPEAPLGESFDEEPLGFKEVELPNGDIEMVPYYTEEDIDDGDDKTTT